MSLSPILRPAFALLLVSVTAPQLAAAPQGSERWVDASDIHVAYVDGSTDAEISYAVHCASQVPGPVDLSFDVLISVGGVVVDFLPHLIIIGGGGGQTCGGSCPTGDCSGNGPDSTCADFGQFPGGNGCACDVVVYGGGNTYTNLQRGVPVTVEVVPGPGTEVDMTLANNVATVIFDEVFPSWCYGDGGDQLGCTNCPCGNNAPQGTPGGCINSAGTAARLSASGDPSVSLPSGSTTDLRLALHAGPANAFCILNSGDAVAPSNAANPCFGLNSGAQAAAYDGLRCAITNTRRHGGRSADASGNVGLTNAPWGGEGGPPAGLAVAGGGFAAGATRYFQVVNRDNPLLGCMRGLNTSQAVEVTFTP